MLARQINKAALALVLFGQRQHSPLVKRLLQRRIIGAHELDEKWNGVVPCQQCRTAQHQFQWHDSFSAFYLFQYTPIGKTQTFRQILYGHSCRLPRITQEMTRVCHRFETLWFKFIEQGIAHPGLAKHGRHCGCIARKIIGPAGNLFSQFEQRVKKGIGFFIVAGHWRSIADFRTRAPNLSLTRKCAVGYRAIQCTAHPGSH